MGMYNAQNQAAVFETRYEPRQPPLAGVTRVDSVPAHVSWLLSSEEKEIRKEDKPPSTLVEVRCDSILKTAKHDQRER